MLPLKLRHLSLIFIIALLLAIWAGRAQLLELAISSYMQSFGMKNVVTDIHHLGLGQSHLSRIGFTLATETGLFKLEAHDISIYYNLEQLSEGRADRLAISKLDLYYQDITKTPEDAYTISKALEPQKIIAALGHALREYIIFNTFFVEHIRLEGDSFGALQSKPLQLNGRNDDSTLSAEFILQNPTASNQQNELRQLVITRLTHDALIAELRYTTRPGAVPAKLELNILDTAINGNYDVHPRQLKHWLQPIVNITDVSEIKNVNGTFLSNFESDKKISSTITALAETYAFRKFNAENIVVKIKLENPANLPVEHIKILNGSSIKADKFSYDNVTFDSSLINMAGVLSKAAGALKFTGGVSADKLAIDYESQVLQLKGFTARVSADPDNLQADGNFSTAAVPSQFAFTLGHDFNKSHGRLSIKPLKLLDLNTENSKLSLLLTPWPYSFDLLSGSIRLTSDAAWSQNNDFRLTNRIKLVKAGGHYGELVFSGLSFEHELEILPDLRSIRSGKINLQFLDSGVTARNISTVLTLEKADTGPLPQFLIQGLYGEIFDGSFSGEDFVFDLNKSTNRFKIKAINIDLAKIVETQQLEDIRVTGRVDGTIPVEINEQGIFIEHGAFLNNVRTGTIHYNPASGTDQLQQNPVTGIALDALRDFRYSHLSADVNFTPEGMLIINLKLKGTSPELDTTRPVHLNINTEQNLISLLKSLRYAEGISANIDKRVRRQYEKSGSYKQAE